MINNCQVYLPTCCLLKSTTARPLDTGPKWLALSIIQWGFSFRVETSRSSFFPNTCSTTLQQLPKIHCKLNANIIMYTIFFFNSIWRKWMFFHNVFALVSPIPFIWLVPGTFVICKLHLWCAWVCARTWPMTSCKTKWLKRHEFSLLFFHNLHVIKSTQ